MTKVVARGSCRLLLPEQEQRRGRPVLLASIGASMLGASAPPPLTEQRTGVSFPGELEYCAGHDGCPIIAGAGARTKKIAGLKSLDVYALALFVDQGAVRSSLGGMFSGTDAASLAQDQRLFDELLRHEDIEKTLHIVITSGVVKQKAFLSALEERLKPRLQAAGQLAALDTFKRQFDDAAFRKGLEITFTAQGDKLTTTIDSMQVGAIASPELTRTLLDVYLGADPASKGAKESIGHGLASMVLA